MSAGMVFDLDRARNNAGGASELNKLTVATFSDRESQVLNSGLFTEIPRGSQYVIPQDISALVFDFDGTTSPIGLTEGWRQMAFKQVIKDIIEERSSSSDRNHYLPVRGIHAESVGQPEWKMAGIIADGLSANNINILQMAVFQRWLQQVRTLLDAKRESLNDRPHFVAGIPYLVEGAKSRGLKTAICTAGHDQFVGQALKTFGTYELYDELVFTNLHEGVRHKPEPDPYLKAFELLGIESRNALVFEDSVSGALSGIRSGATVLFQPAGDRKPRRRAILKLQEQVLKEDYNLERYSGRVILLAPGEGWRQVRFGVGSADTALSKAG